MEMRVKGEIYLEVEKALSSLQRSLNTCIRHLVKNVVALTQFSSESSDDPKIVPCEICGSSQAVNLPSLSAATSSTI